MIPKIYNFKEQYAGDTFNGVEIAMTDGDNLPIDLTGCGIRMQIKTAPNGQTIKELNVGNGITIINAINGTFRINPFINPTKPCNYVYDLEWTHPNGVVRTRLKGAFPITEDVTR